MANELTLRDKATNLQRILDERMVQIARSLPPGTMSADYFSRVVLTLCQKNPALMDANLPSLLGAVMQSAQLGLSPDSVLGEAYFLPFKGVVQFVPGYRGLIKLAYQSEQIAKISARVVREGDDFSFAYGIKEKLVHVPKAQLSAPVTHVYASAKIKRGDTNFLVMTKEEIEAVRARSPSARSGRSTPWTTDPEAMAQKTVLRRLCKFLPTSVSPPFQRALALDELAENGLKQHLGKEFGAPDEQQEDTEEQQLADAARIAEQKE